MNINKTIKTEVRNFLFESFINERVKGEYRIADFPQIFRNTNLYDEYSIEAYVTMLQDAFRKNGDKGVQDMMSDMFDIEIYPISRGKYVFGNKPVDAGYKTTKRF